MTNKTTAKPKRLTAKQEAFCVNYFVMRNATQAAIKAGYSPHLINNHSTNLLQNVTIKARLATLQAEAPIDPDIATIEERKRRLTEIYRANLVDFVDNDGNVKKLSTKIPHHAALSEYSVTSLGHDEGEVVTKRTLKLRDPIAAIAEHNKMEHIYSGDLPPPNEVINNFVFTLPDGTKVAPRALIEGEVKRIDDHSS